MDLIPTINSTVGDITSTSELRLPQPVDEKHRADIDGLRGIAVLAVVVFHAFPNYLSGGFLGVDVFFVISGYLITSIIYISLELDEFSFVRFYVRRIRRIFPSLIIVLIACYSIGWYILLTEEYKNLGAHIAAGASFLSNFLLWTESGYFDVPSSKKPLLHLWSLAIEEQFYILWPFFLFSSCKMKLNPLLVSAGLTLASFILNIMTVQQNSTQAFYWPTSRAWELTIGACLILSTKCTIHRFGNLKSRYQSLYMLIAYFEESGSKSTILLNIVSISGTFLVVLPMYFFSKTIVFPGWWALAPTIGTALIIWAGPTAWINRFVLSSRLLVGVGLVSYPLYLWHWPLLVFTKIVIEEQTFEKIRLIIVIMSIVFAWMTYVFIENPLRLGSFGGPKCTLLCISMLVIGTIGYHSYQMNGLSFRFPNIIRDIVNFKYNCCAIYRARTCMLRPDQDESNFGECVINTDQPASTAVILWGDSFAAHLRPGIEDAKSDFRVTQLTTQGCPPILGTEATYHPKCNQINNYVMKRIYHEKPNTVLLAARWSHYNWKKIQSSVVTLRNASVNNIYMIGPVPEWQNTLAKCLIDYFLRDPLHRIPERMMYGLTPNIDGLDAAVSDFATNITIKYISAHKILCNSKGCLTRTGRASDTLTTYDNGHLTFAGSKSLVSGFPRALLHSK